MDRIIEKKKWTPQKIIGFSVLGIIIIVIMYRLFFGDTGSKLNVQSERITTYTVKRDDFQDYMTVTGVVQPIRTIYLDAIEGGRVEEILIEEGKMVEKGDAILTLSNTNLQLSIMNREAELAEQLNNLRNTRLLMEQNKLDLRKQILELNYQITQQKRDYENNKRLYDGDHICETEFAETKERYEYLIEKKAVLLETQKQDSIFRQVQIEQLEASVARMQENLSLVRKKLESLEVTAAISGQLVSLNAEIGEAKSPGERLGQINVLDSYKINGDIDEHYISRVGRGLTGEFEFAGNVYQLTVTKIYPQVENGRFSVDMEFTDEFPENMRIGQTFRIKLELGESEETLLLARGGFYQNTGGQWVYILDESGERAIKTDVRLGRQNPRFYEVLDGLTPGDIVITSSYDNFGDADQLILK
jgi:HlyD family secretion protein